MPDRRDGTDDADADDCAPAAGAQGVDHLDRGSERAQHARFTTETGLLIYFCDPQSPWQRGTNENTKGLLRQYWPKGADLRHLTATDCDAVALQLKPRPRKTLEWKTPGKALNKRLVASTA